MHTILSSNDQLKEKLPNSDKIIMHLALTGKMNKWDIKQKVNLAYPRVHEAIASLEAKALVCVVSEKEVKNKIPSKEYGLTFKGILAYLSLAKLERPKTVWTNNETEKEILEQYREGCNEYNKNINEIRNVLKLSGEQLNFPIFKEIDWLSESFGIYIYELIREISKNQKNNQTNFFGASKLQFEKKRQDLDRSITIKKKNPFLQKFILFTEDGTGRKETEINSLEDDKKELMQINDLIASSNSSENTYLKNLFADQFFERLGHLPKNKTGKNEPLLKLVEDRLDEGKKSLKPLERAIKKMSGDECD